MWSSVNEWKYIFMNFFVVCYTTTLSMNSSGQWWIGLLRHWSQIWKQLSAASPTNRPQPKVIILIVIIKLKLWPAADCKAKVVAELCENLLKVGVLACHNITWMSWHTRATVGLSTQVLKLDSLDPDPWSEFNVISCELQTARSLQALLSWTGSYTLSWSTITQ